MTGNEAMQEACAIVAMAFNSIGDFEHASDCFCSGQDSGYLNNGRALEYVRNAVIAQLIRDGFKVNP